MEVLISIGILAVGLLGVAALIPLGRIALRETNKSDRTGACGRAGIQEVKIRRLLDYNYWQCPGPAPPWWGAVFTSPFAPPVPRVEPFAIDPLACNAGFTTNLGDASSPIARLSLNMAPAMIDPTFRWADELTFDIPEGSTKRPRQLVRDLSNRVAPYPPLPTEPAFAAGALTPQNAGNFSWFFTVSPAASEAALPMAQKRLFDVSVVVCNQRVLSATSEYAAVANFPGAAMPMMPGGGTIQFQAGSIVPTTNPPLEIKFNQWVAMVGRNATTGAWDILHWYRVVGVNNDTPAQPMLTLDGPDWPAATYQNPTVIIINGVTGVYTTTVRLDQ